MMTIVHERLPEIGILRAIGRTARIGVSGALLPAGPLPSKTFREL